MANAAEQKNSEGANSDIPMTPSVEELNRVFKKLLTEHGEVFARVKRLGMRSEGVAQRELAPPYCSEFVLRECGAMAEGYRAFKVIVQTQLLATQLVQGQAADDSELAEAMAALDALNPSSPEWGPTFFQVSEWVEAHVGAGGCLGSR